LHPSIEDHLVGLACGVSDRRKANAPAMRALRRRVDDSKLLEVLDRHHLTALIGTRLAELGLLPADLRPHVEAQLQDNRMRALLYEHVGTQVLGALEQHGIRALAFKGFALADAVYDDPGFRRYGDIDVLVPATNLVAAVTALEPLGYRGLPAERATAGLPDLHLRAQDLSGRLPLIELHWRVHWFEHEFSAGMLGRSRVIGARRRATPADELAALLLIYARDGFRGLRLAADLAAWWDVHGTELSPGAMDELSQAHPELGPIWATALLVAERVTGLPANQAMYDLAPSRRGRLALRLTNWPSHGAVAQAGADVTLVDCLLSPPGQVAVTARRYLFPPSAVLDGFYGLPHDARLRRAAWRVVHPPKVLARYGIALWHARTQLPAPTAVNIALRG
jgi:hypothetical protein